MKIGTWPTEFEAFLNSLRDTKIPSGDYEEFQNRVRNHGKRHGWTQEQVGRVLGLAESRVVSHSPRKKVQPLLDAYIRPSARAKVRLMTETFQVGDRVQSSLYHGANPPIFGEVVTLYPDRPVMEVKHDSDGSVHRGSCNLWVKVSTTEVL